MGIIFHEPSNSHWQLHSHQTMETEVPNHISIHLHSPESQMPGQREAASVQKYLEWELPIGIHWGLMDLPYHFFKKIETLDFPLF